MTHQWQTGIHIEVGDWEALRTRAMAVRMAVFVHEQGVPLELELDEFDAVSVHALATDVSGTTLGTGRLLPDGHIGRLCVTEQARGLGVGRAILQALMARGRREGHEVFILHAQVHALGFYERLGYVAEGDIFDEAGIDHQKMVWRAAPGQAADQG